MSANHAHLYCKSLRRVTKAELINALHQSLMQFNAITQYEDLKVVDTRPVTKTISQLMSRAGHPGYTK